MPRAENQSAARRCTVSSSAGSSLRVCSLRNDENSVWYLNQLSSESRQRRNRPERSRNSRMLCESCQPVTSSHNPADSRVSTEVCRRNRSEEHTSELQSLMRNSYAVFCLKKKKTQN